MLKKTVITLSILLIFFIIGGAGIPNVSIHLCGINDQECHRKFFQTFGRYYSKLGIPELGLPVLDPYKLANVTVSVPNVMNLTLVEGNVRGISGCSSLKYLTFIENKTKISELICNNITIWGTYDLTMAPLIKNSLGPIIRGNGNIRVELHNWYFNTQYPFKLEKHANGDIYIRCLFNEAKFNYTIGNVALEIENVKLADEDISQIVVDAISKDSKFFEPTLGRYFTDRSLQFYYDAHSLFFDNVPTKMYIIEDLSNYL